MPKTLGELTEEVSYRLGDTAAQIWSAAEIEEALREALNDMAIRSRFLWERALLPDVADQAVYTIPERVYEIERSTWNNERLVPFHRDHLMRIDPRFETTRGPVIAFGMDQDGLRSFRKYRVPVAGGQSAVDESFEVVLEMMGVDAFLSSSGAFQGATTYTRTSLRFDPAKYDDVTELRWEIMANNGENVNRTAKLMVGNDLIASIEVTPNGFVDASSEPFSVSIAVPSAAVIYRLRLDDVPDDGLISISSSRIVVVQGPNRTRTRIQRILTRSEFGQTKDIDELAGSMNLAGDPTGFRFGDGFYDETDDWADVFLAQTNFFRFDASKWHRITGFSYEGIIGAAAVAGEAFVEVLLADRETRAAVSGTARLDVEDTDSSGELLYFELPISKDCIVDGRNYASMNRFQGAESGFTSGWIVRQELYIELDNLQKFQVHFDIDAQYDSDFFGDIQVHRYRRETDFSNYRNYAKAELEVQAAFHAPGDGRTWEGRLLEDGTAQATVQLPKWPDPGDDILSAEFDPSGGSYRVQFFRTAGAGGGVLNRYARVVLTYPESETLGRQDTIIEFSRRPSEMTSPLCSVFEIPDSYLKFLRDFAMARALEREGPGQDPELAAHFMAKYEEGLARIKMRMAAVDKARTGQFGGAPRGGGIGPPPVPSLPWPYSRRRGRW